MCPCNVLKWPEPEIFVSDSLQIVISCLTNSLPSIDSLPSELSPLTFHCPILIRCLQFIWFLTCPVVSNISEGGIEPVAHMCAVVHPSWLLQWVMHTFFYPGRRPILCSILCSLFHSCSVGATEPTECPIIVLVPQLICRCSRLDPECSKSYSRWLPLGALVFLIRQRDKNHAAARDSKSSGELMTGCNLTSSPGTRGMGVNKSSIKPGTSLLRC